MNVMVAMFVEYQWGTSTAAKNSLTIFTRSQTTMKWAHNHSKHMYHNFMLKYFSYLHKHVYTFLILNSQVHPWHYFLKLLKNFFVNPLEDSKKSTKKSGEKLSQLRSMKITLQPCQEHVVIIIKKNSLSVLQRTAFDFPSRLESWLNSSEALDQKIKLTILLKE